MFKLSRKKFYILLFGILWVITAFSSFFHAIEFFELTNVTWMGIILAMAFEIGQASVLMSILTSSQDRKKYTPWILMCILTLVQIIGNVYSSYKYIMLNSPENLKYFKEPIFIWTQLPDAEATVIITYVSAAILPIVALLMTSMITNYLTDQAESKSIENKKVEEKEDKQELHQIIEEFKNPLINENSILQMEKQGLEESNKKKDEEIEQLKKQLEEVKNNDKEKEDSQQGLPESNVEFSGTTEVQESTRNGGEITTEEDKSDNDGRWTMVPTKDQTEIEDTSPESSEQKNNEIHSEPNVGTSTEIPEEPKIVEEVKKPSHFINL